MASQSSVPMWPIQRGNRGYWSALMAVYLLAWIVVMANEQGVELLGDPLEGLRQLASFENVAAFGLLLSICGLAFARPWERLLRSMPPKVRESRWAVVVMFLCCLLLCLEVTILALHAHRAAVGSAVSLGSFLVSEIVTLVMIGELAGVGIWLWFRGEPLADYESSLRPASAKARPQERA